MDRPILIRASAPSSPLKCSGVSPSIPARIYIEENPGPGGGNVQIDGLCPAIVYWNYTYGLDLNCVSGNDASGYNYDLIASSSPLLGVL